MVLSLAIADMFVHADRNILIELFFVLTDIAMIALVKCDLVVDPVLQESCPHIFILTTHRVVDRHGNSVVFDHIDREESPARPYLNDLVAGFQSQFPAYVLVVIHLRLIKRFRVLGPVPFRVSNGPFEHKLEETRVETIVKFCVLLRLCVREVVLTQLLEKHSCASYRVEKYKGLLAVALFICENTTTHVSKCLEWFLGNDVYIALNVRLYQPVIKKQQASPLCATVLEKNMNIGRSRGKIAVTRAPCERHSKFFLCAFAEEREYMPQEKSREHEARSVMP